MEYPTILKSLEVKLTQVILGSINKDTLKANTNLKPSFRNSWGQSANTEVIAVLILVLH